MKKMRYFGPELKPFNIGDVIVCVGGGAPYVVGEDYLVEAYTDFKGDVFPAVRRLAGREPQFTGKAKWVLKAPIGEIDVNELL